MSDKAQVTYTLNGITKSFEVSMDRLDELLAWAGREFSDGIDIGGPDMVTHKQSTGQKLDRKRRSGNA